MEENVTYSDRLAGNTMASAWLRARSARYQAVSMVLFCQAVRINCIFYHGGPPGNPWKLYNTRLRQYLSGFRSSIIKKNKPRITPPAGEGEGYPHILHILRFV